MNFEIFFGNFGQQQNFDVGRLRKRRSVRYHAILHWKEEGSSFQNMS